MITDVVSQLFKNRTIQIGNKTIEFGNNGKLTIETESGSQIGEYAFSIKNGKIHLITKPPVINGSTEVIVDIVLDEKIILLFD